VKGKLDPAQNLRRLSPVATTKPEIPRKDEQKSCNDSDTDKPQQHSP
jgi:hypothetical protein